jgi:hypothetical protein
MNYDKLNIFEQIFIPIGVLIPILLWYASFIVYQKYYIAKGRVKEKVNIEIFGDEGGGQMLADGFGMRPPLPIEDNSKDEIVQHYVKRYNKIVKIFWIWTVFGTILILIVLNLIRHK